MSSFSVTRPRVLRNIFARLVQNKQQEEPVERYSRFKRYVPDMDENADAAADICDKALHVAHRRFLLAHQLKSISEQSDELTCYALLDEEEAAALGNMLAQFTGLTKERNELIRQLTAFDKALPQLGAVECDALGAVSYIQDAEVNQRILRQDIGCLEGEKADLQYERKLLESGLRFSQQFSIAMLVLFALVTFYLGYRFMVEPYTIFVPTTALVLCAIAVLTLVYVFRRHTRHALVLNIKKQQRAVRILNKKNAVFAHHTNFLQYEYKKYKVRNARMLSQYLSDYKHYRHVTARIDSIRKLMYETEYQIESFLRAKHIAHSRFSTVQLAHTMNVSDKIRYARELAEQKQVLERELTQLDDVHESLWHTLETLAVEDASDERVVSKMMQLYVDEANRLYLNIDNEATDE